MSHDRTALQSPSTADPGEQQPEALAPVAVRRLGWAGVELNYSGARLVIDLLEELGSLAPIIGEARTELPAPSGPVDVALVTHLHTDHTDASALGRRLAPGGSILRPHPAAGEGLETVALAEAEEGLKGVEREQVPLHPWESLTRGPFKCTAVPAVDGFGDPQVSWVVEVGGRRFLHAGDTLFHGSWWLIAMRAAPIDLAFLPINGPRTDLPHRQPPSPFAACLDPEQAAAAAHILGAARAVPIHYDTIHRPPVYAQVDDPAGRFVKAAEELGVETLVLEPGELAEL
jgi:L-ascorbate metabolism protein UlaG (beta-lactamase superfamily)